MDREDATLILSPHCDDAPISVGAALMVGYLGPAPTVSVVYSRSRFSKDFPGNGPEKEITALRNQEELEAARMAGYEVEFWGFGEPSTRKGYTQPSDIFDPAKRPRADESWERVLLAIDAAVCNHRGLVMGPLGCGGHIDHLIVREAFLAACVKHPRLSVGFYEDLPYSNRLSDEDVLALIPTPAGRRLSPHLVTEGLEKKRLLVQVYRSQRTSVHLHGINGYWSRRGGERLWLMEGVRQ
jgi:LmbE family N-acetylglucosaminyl deacetylase